MNIAFRRGWRLRHIAACALAAGIATVSVACSSSSTSHTATPSPATSASAAGQTPLATSSAAAPHTQQPAPTAFAQPTLDANTINAPLKGYSAQVPDGWHARTNFATDTGARFPTDAFFAEKVEGDVQPNIALTCYASDPAKTLETYRDEWQQFVTSFSSRDIRTTETTVGGARAFVFSYAQTLHGESNDPTPVAKDYDVEKRDYILLESGCRWVIAVLTPPGQFATYGPLIDAFVSALKFSPRLT